MVMFLELITLSIEACEFLNNSFRFYDQLLKHNGEVSQGSIRLTGTASLYLTVIKTIRFPEHLPFYTAPSLFFEYHRHGTGPFHYSTAGHAVIELYLAERGSGSRHNNPARIYGGDPELADRPVA